MQNVYAFAWSYDAVGNRRWQNRLGQQSYFTYDAANALRKSFPVGGSATYYSYDLNGNCTKIAAPASQTTYFAYNSVNLMTQVTFRNGVFELLLLRRPEPQARAPRQQRPGVLHVRQGWPLPTGRAQHHGNCPRRIYPRLRAGPRHRRHGRREDQHPDHELLPVPRLRPTWQRPRILNAAGAVTGSFEYNAFGELLLNNPPPEGTRFGFSVPAWIMLKDDPDGRFVLTPTRTGNLAMGRFLQKDPVPTDGENPYAYARNNPVLWTDAEGHQAGDVVVGERKSG